MSTAPAPSNPPPVPRPAPAPARRRVRNARGEGERLREDLVAAAEELIAETGDADALTLRGLARHVGIAAPSVYRHFPDLEHLKQAVVERAFTRFAEARDTASQPHTDPAAALLARCRAYCQFALDNPGPYRFMFSHQAPRTRLADPAGPVGAPASGRPTASEAAFTALAESIRRCQHAGLAPATHDPAYLAAQVWPALHGLALLRLNAVRFPWPAPLDDMVDYAVSQLIDLAAPRGEPAAPTGPASPRS